MKHEHQQHQRAELTDENIAALPQAESGFYIVYDTKLPGFRRTAGKSTKLLVFQGEHRWPDGTREPVYKRLGDPKHVPVSEARARVLEELARLARLTDPDVNAGMTFGEAWLEYVARLEERIADGKASQKTLDDYSQKYTAHLAPSFAKRALKDITRSEAKRQHKRIKGDYAANSSFRVAHAIYRYAATELEVPLPTAVPFRGRDLFHAEQTRETKVTEPEQRLGSRRCSDR